MTSRERDIIRLVTGFQLSSLLRVYDNPELLTEPLRLFKLDYDEVLQKLIDNYDVFRDLNAHPEKLFELPEKYINLFQVIFYIYESQCRKADEEATNALWIKCGLHDSLSKN